MARRLLRSALIGSIIGGFIFSMVTGVVAYITPQLFESEALIEITPGSISLTGDQEVTDRTIATACGVLTSNNILEQIVRNLELVKHWNLDANSCITKLKAISTVEAIEDSNLISIRVRYVDKVDARDIAEETVDSYSQYMKDVLNRQVEQKLRELNKSVREQEDKVEERRKVLSTIAKMKSIGLRLNSEGALVPYQITKGDEKPSPEEEFNAGMGLRDYLDARKEFEMDRDLLETLKLEQLNEAILHKRHLSLLRVHTQPEVAETPCAPDVTALISTGTSRGALIGLLLAIPLTLIRTPKKPVGSKSGEKEAA